MNCGPEQMRDNAESCRSLAENAANDPARNRFHRMAQAWDALAEAQEWLDGKSPPAQPKAEADVRFESVAK
jgi:hypothetical protein